MVDHMNQSHVQETQAQTSILWDFLITFCYVFLLNHCKLKIILTENENYTSNIICNGKKWWVFELCLVEPEVWKQFFYFREIHQSGINGKKKT